MSELSQNRLKNEKSIYLNNLKSSPINWWPYGPEPIQRAKDENKPIFLSIGHSSSYLSTLMSSESFMSNEVAEALNDNFICISIDKDEYPDIDNYYQTACQLYTQSGGYPLTSFLLPSLMPYYAGTYFPMESSGDKASFLDLINELTRAYKDDYDQVCQNAEQVTETIAKGLMPKDKVEYQGHFPAPMAIMGVLKQFQDSENGGYGDVPKMPRFAFLEWTIEQMIEGMIEKDEGDYIIKTIENMLLGGLSDHAKGGVHSYTFDKEWKVPCFEKHLYDQAGLLRLLSKVGLVYPSPLIFDTLMNTLEYLETEMLSDNQYFFTSQSSDSEGVEGLYFTYSEEEFDDAINRSSINEEENELLTKNLDKIKKWFSITEEGNYISKLNVINLDNKFAEEFYSQEGWDLVRKARKAILEDRKMRIPPKTDTKGVATYNFMVISALADVVQYCQIDSISQYAFKLLQIAVEGTYKNFMITDEENGVMIKHTTTAPTYFPFMEDYIFFVESQLRVYEITGKKVFKENVLNVLSLVLKEFINGDKLKTRPVEAGDLVLYPNQDVIAFDQQYKSSVATLVYIAQKATILFDDNEINGYVEEIKEELIHEILKNPFHAGEALRALTYPEQAYRLVKIPRSWVDDPKFRNFMPFFMPRFILDYHSDEDQNWQIMTTEAVELQGTGLDEFINTLSPQEQEVPKSDN